jgi:hypothetical protein
MVIEYQSLKSLAANLGLPQNYLRRLANSHQIPFLFMNNRRRFNEVKVRQALNKLSVTDAGDDILNSLKAVKASLAKRVKSEKLSRSPAIIAALIQAVAIILVPFISCLLSSHSNNKRAPMQVNVMIFSDAEMKGDHSPVIVNSPNSTFNTNTYIIPSQSVTRSEISETDANRPK